MSEKNTPRRLHLASLLRHSQVLHSKQSGNQYICVEYPWTLATTGRGENEAYLKWDWEAKKKQRKRNSKELELKTKKKSDSELLKRILRPKKSLRDHLVNHSTVNYESLPWLLFLICIVVVPAAAYFQLRRDFKSKANISPNLSANLPLREKSSF